MSALAYYENNNGDRKDTRLHLLYHFERGWYDISKEGQTIKYLYYPGEEIRSSPIYQENKEKTDENLRKFTQIIKEKLDLLEEKEASKKREQEKGKLNFDFNQFKLKTYDASAIFKGEEFTEEASEYRKDGSIIFSKENEGYKRIWNMSLYLGNEEMVIITTDKVLVLPSYANTDDRARFFECGYEEKDGKVIDVLTKKTLNVVALMHTHPNGSAPSTSGGDGSFMAAHFPFKPNYVLMIKKENISRSAIAFIVGSENPYNNTNGYSGYAISDLDKNLTIANLIKTPKGYPLRELTLQNKANFKLIIPKFRTR